MKSAVSSDRGMSRRLAAVWFVDIVGYTRLAAQDEDAALAAVQRFQDRVRDVLEVHGGRLVKFMGDAALAEFPSARGATLAALDLLRDFSPAGAAGSQPVVARAGIHMGEVASTADGDLLGEDVNLASRIHTAAEPGQVAVSADVARQLRHLSEIAFEPLGERELKGVPELTAVYLARRADGGGDRRAAPAPPSRSIAVLPFANMSADPENEYFSDGVMEEILTLLAAIEGLKVISRTSAMRYKGAKVGLRRIGEELGVATVLEGSVRRAGNRVRITAQLIDARTDEHLWAERYDRDLEDIFAIQTDVAERIVESLQVQLTPKEKARLTAEPTSVGAYQDYLRGLWFLNRRTPDDLQRAIDYFERSVDADPGYAQARAGIASACVLKLHWGEEAGELDPDRAVAEAERAQEIDPGCGHACAARGMVRIYEREWALAEHDFRCALECAPGDATARQWYAHYLAAMGRFEEAFEQIAKARELDPLSLAVITEAGNVQLLARRYDVAIRLYREALELDSSFAPSHYKLMELYTIQGRYAEAVDELGALGYVGPEELAPIRRDLAAGDPGSYFAWLRSMPEARGWPLTYVAWGQLVSGDHDAAIATLERAVEQRDWYLIRLVQAPHWDPLREDPRFQALLARIGLKGSAPSGGRIRDPAP